jgi:hypothetical protein
LNFFQGVVAVVSYSTDVNTTFAWLSKLRRLAERAKPKSSQAQLSLVAIGCIDSEKPRQTHVRLESRRIKTATERERTTLMQHNYPPPKYFGITN